MHRDEQIRDVVGQRIPQLMIIVASLIFGICAFGAYVVNMQGLPDFGQIQNEKFTPLTLIAIGMALSSVVLANVLPRIITAHQRNQLDSKAKLETNASKLAETHQVVTIIAAALFEGSGFLALMAFMLDGSVVGFCLAVVMVLSIASMFPTPGRVVSWIDRQLAHLDDTSSLRENL